MRVPVAAAFPGAELGTSTVARFHVDGISFDSSGHYAEYGEFDYSGG